MTGTTAKAPSKKPKTGNEKRELLMRQVRAQAKRDAKTALFVLRGEIDGYRSLKPRSEAALEIAHTFLESIEIRDRQALFFVHAKDISCELVLNLDCELAHGYTLDQMRPAYAEIDYNGVLVTVWDISDDLHQLLAEIDQIARDYDSWLVLGDDGDRDSDRDCDKANREE